MLNLLESRPIGSRIAHPAIVIKHSIEKLPIIFWYFVGILGLTIIFDLFIKFVELVGIFFWLCFFLDFGSLGIPSWVHVFFFFFFLLRFFLFYLLLFFFILFSFPKLLFSIYCVFSLSLLLLIFLLIFFLVCWLLLIVLWLGRNNFFLNDPVIKFYCFLILEHDIGNAGLIKLMNF